MPAIPESNSESVMRFVPLGPMLSRSQLATCLSVNAARMTMKLLLGACSRGAMSLAQLLLLLQPETVKAIF